jgi:hypothetical protein
MKQLGKAGNEALRNQINKSTQPGYGGPESPSAFGSTTAL